MTDVGEIIKALNDFGRFQHWLVLLITLSGPTVAFHMFGQLFMVPKEPHYCNTSWFRAIGSNLTEDAGLNVTIPKKADGTFEECFMYTPVNWELDDLIRYGLNSTEKCRDGWVYPSKREPSLVTQVCNYHHYCYVNCYGLLCSLSATCCHTQYLLEEAYKKWTV